MNCWLQEGVDRSSWTSESDEKEAKFMEEADRKHWKRWRTGRLVAEDRTAVIVIHLTVFVYVGKI